MRNRHRHTVIAIAAGLVAATGCAGSADDEVAIVEGTNPPTTMSAPTPTSPTTTPTNTVDNAASSSELVEFVNPAMGGVRYAVAPDYHHAVIHDSIVLYTEPPAQQVWGPRSNASIGLVTQSAGGTRIDGVDELLDSIRSVENATVEPTGETAELFGYELTEYEVSNGADLEEPRLFSATRFGAPVDSEAAPFPYALLSVADTPAGVLLAMLHGADEENARASTAALETLLATAELIGPGLESAVPPGEVIAPEQDGAPPPRATVIEDAPPPLETAFASIEAATYQLPNIGRPATIDVDDGWFAQPNFPGIVVFTAPGSVGPGDLDLVMISDVVAMVPTEAGPRRGGEPVPVEDVETLLAMPPTGFEVSNVQTLELGTASATQFDLRADGTSTCALGDPCEATFITSYGVTQQLGVGRHHRIWWIENGSEPAHLFIASALAEPEFIERATALVATVQFL